MRAAIILVAFILSACAPDAQQSTSTDAPSAPTSKTSVWCGETIISTQGFAFKLDLATGEMSLLKDGTRGYPPVCNGWGCRPGCWYQIVDGEPGPLP